MADHRILVIRPGALGDTIFTEPAIAALRAEYPASVIELVGRTDFLPLLVGGRLANVCVSMDSATRRDLGGVSLPAASSVESSNAAGFASLFSDGPLEIPESDIIVAFLPDSDGALSARLRAHCGKAVVFDPRPPCGGTERSARLTGQTVTSCPGSTRGATPLHIVDHLLSALKPLGVRPLRNFPLIECKAEWAAAAHSLLPDRRDYAVIHAGSGGRRKLWQSEKWAAVISKLAPLDVVMTRGPADEGIVEEIIAAVGETPRVAVIEGQPVTTIAGILGGAMFYLGCDSGVTHLAAALGVPTVALFGPTDPRVWAPRGRCVRVIAGPGTSTNFVTAPDVLRVLDDALAVM